jgi:hypothetical protein
VTCTSLPCTPLSSVRTAVLITMGLPNLQPQLNYYYPSTHLWGGQGLDGRPSPAGEEGQGIGTHKDIHTHAHTHLWGGQGLDGRASPAGEEGEDGLAQLLEDRVLDGGLEAEDGLWVEVKGGGLVDVFVCVGGGEGWWWMDGCVGV